MRASRWSIAEANGRAIPDDLLEVLNLGRKNTRERRGACIVDGRVCPVQELSALSEAGEGTRYHAVDGGRGAGVSHETWDGLGDVQDTAQCGIKV